MLKPAIDEAAHHAGLRMRNRAHKLIALLVNVVLRKCVKDVVHDHLRPVR